jgi:hypothetical protein
LDAELNLPDERYSLELRRRLAEEAAKSSFDETLQSIGKNTGGHVPKRQIEELVKRAAVDFDAFYDMRHGSTAEGQGTGSVLVTSVDGNETQIRELRRMARKNNFDLTIIVDIIHVVEYLWAAGRVLHFASGWELENWVRHRLLEILRGKAGLMAGGMRRSATRRGLSFKAREPADTCAHYLLKYSPYLRYDCYLSQGLPIATGVIEGACRHLVKDRMDVTGARWSLTGAEAVLRLRALRSSQDFDEYWAFHEVNEYERTHHTLYAGGIVPPTIASLPASKRNNLKVIK